MKLTFKKRKSPQFGVTINGQLLHHASGDPVKGGDLVAGQTYRVDLSGILSEAPDGSEADPAPPRSGAAVPRKPDMGD